MSPKASFNVIHSVAKIPPGDPCGDGNYLAQALPADLRLASQAFHGDEVLERHCGSGAVEQRGRFNSVDFGMILQWIPDPHRHELFSALNAGFRAPPDDRLHLIGDIGRGQPRLGCPDRVNAKHQVRPCNDDAIKGIYHSRDVLDELLDLNCFLFQKSLVLPEELDLNGRRTVGQVSDNVHHELPEFDPQGGLARLDAGARVINHLFDVAFSLPPQFYNE